jgi:hypothetical protein
MVYGMKPLIAAAIAAAALVVIALAVALHGHAVQQEKACEFQKAYQGYDPTTAALACRSGT